MGNRIIITPSGYGTASDKIFVGKNFTNNLSGFNGKIFVIDLDNLPRPEPTIDLPPYTIRLRYRDGVTPSFAHGTATQVSQSPNVWDLTYESGSWRNLLNGHTDLIEVLGANSTGVWRMDGMFNYCENLTTVAVFDTSACTYLQQMFNYCSSLTSLPLFDTSNAIDIHYFVSCCTSLTTVPLFDTHNATDTSGFFYGCTNLTSVPKLDTSSATNMYGMFAECTSLKSIPLIDCSSATDMESMFNGCTNLISVPLLNTINTTNMKNMFVNCISITTVPLFNTANVTNMSFMFANCTGFTTIPLFNTSNATNVNDMFSSCHNVQSGALALYQQMSTQTNPPTNHDNTFYNCGDETTTGQAELNQIPLAWK